RWDNPSAIPTAIATTFLYADAVSAPTMSLVVMVSIDGEESTRATARRASGLRDAHNSAVGEAAMISEASPGPARAPTAVGGAGIEGAPAGGDSRVSSCQPLVASTQIVSGVADLLNADSVGTSPGLATATMTMSGSRTASA